MDLVDLCTRLRQGQLSAVAQAISLVEDKRHRMQPTIVSLLKQVRQSAGGYRVGFTGPPGVGKSSLVAEVARCLRSKGLSVGILAIDPSSPFSGGSLLGDRVRIRPDAQDNQLYVRSMASGGDQGGLARAAPAAVEVLSAAFDRVLVETTGVGQTEIEVKYVVDTTALIVQPAAGDTLQFIKAGIVEIPDLLIINKADLTDAAEQTKHWLMSALHALYAAGLKKETPPLVLTSVLQQTGIESLVALLEEESAALSSETRQQGDVAWATRLFQKRYGEYGVEQAGGTLHLEKHVTYKLKAMLHPLEIPAAIAKDLGLDT